MSFQVCGFLLVGDKRGDRKRRIGKYRMIYTIDENGNPMFKRFEPRDKVYDT